MYLSFVLKKILNQSTEWISNIDSKSQKTANKQYHTSSTQTYGLFYTSSRGLDNLTGRKNKFSFEKLEKKPLFISAGRGFWRQQLDHICTHLKAFAHNNTEFKVLIAEPKLGKVKTFK